MKTLPREPWRGGQICGEQLEYGVVPGRLVFCGELKKPGSPLCERHDQEYRWDNDGMLPKFAPGNALGLAAYRRETMPYMFKLAWEPEEGDTPIPATPEEIEAWQKSDAKHTHYSPYEPPRQVPGTLLDCTPQFSSYHRVEGSETAADYMYCPRFGDVSHTGLPADVEEALIAAYTEHRAADTQWRIVDVTADEEYTYRVRISNRTMYNGDGPDWHSEEWGIHATDGQWHGIPKNPHPPYEHMPFFCANCGY